MNKGVSVFFGFKNLNGESIKKIKAAGFDSFITSADKNFDAENGTFKRQMKDSKKCGLLPSSLHATYKRQELPHFFMDDAIGDKIQKSLIKDIKTAKKYGFKCVVVHLVGQPNDVGTARFERILKVCEKCKVPLALENICDNKPVEFYLKKYENNPYVGFCFDCGHWHSFDPNNDLLAKYGKRLLCVHLHDNDGTDDQHTLNILGNIDWKALAKKFAVANEVSLDYELILYKRQRSWTPEFVLDECFKQACELEEMILKEKQKLKKTKK